MGGLKSGSIATFKNKSGLTGEVMISEVILRNDLSGSAIPRTNIWLVLDNSFFPLVSSFCFAGFC